MNRLGQAIGLSLATWCLAQDTVGPVLPPNPIEMLPLQRSLALMAASRNPAADEVRVLFYGQSIVTQDWWMQVAADLRRAFPQANLIIENRAISAFPANYLIKTAEADVYPFRPDLIIFHCYGPYGPGLAWEKIWEEFRSRTTADVVMLGNHITAQAEVNELNDPTLQTPEGSQYWLNYVFAPQIARRLGLCFPDNRSQWRAFIQAHSLVVTDLLEDSVHLNGLGNELQAAILHPYLTGPRLSPPLDPFNNGRVATVPITDPAIQSRDGRLRFQFVGNRIDILGGTTGTPGFQVLVDGSDPTRLPSGQGHGRSTGWPEHPWWMALLHVSRQQQLVPETWTLTVTRNDLNKPHEFDFEVVGTKTGPDGRGSTTNRFVSNSGRVVIDPTDWEFQQLPYAVGVGFQVFWSSEIRAISHVPATTAPFPLATTLINDLTDGPHVVELVPDDPAKPPVIGGFRVYHPAGSMPGTEPDTSEQVALRQLLRGDQILWVWPAAGNWQPEATPGLNVPWKAYSPDPPVFGFVPVLVPTSDPTLFFRLQRP